MNHLRASIYYFFFGHIARNLSQRRADQFMGQFSVRCARRKMCSFMCSLVLGATHISVEDIRQISKPNENDLSELCAGNMIEGLNEHARYVPAFPLHPVLGECKGEDFERLGAIGSGAYSTVYEAIHWNTRTMVALNVLKNDKLDIVRVRTEECLQHRANFRQSGSISVYISMKMTLSWLWSMSMG
jgi:hypothetical protein